MNTDKKQPPDMSVGEELDYLRAQIADLTEGMNSAIAHAVVERKKLNEAEARADRAEKERDEARALCASIRDALSSVLDLDRSEPEVGLFPVTDKELPEVIKNREESLSRHLNELIAERDHAIAERDEAVSVLRTLSPFVDRGMYFRGEYEGCDDDVRQFIGAALERAGLLRESERPADNEAVPSQGVETVQYLRERLAVAEKRAADAERSTEKAQAERDEARETLSIVESEADTLRAAVDDALGLTGREDTSDETRLECLAVDRATPLNAAIERSTKIIRKIEQVIRKIEQERDDLGCQLEALRAVQRGDVADLRTRMEAVEGRIDTIVGIKMARNDDEKGGA